MNGGIYILHNYCAEYEHVKIRPLQENDIDLLRQWRNDPIISKYLHKIDYITPAMQKRWYEVYLIDQDIITFAIEETHELKRMVGSVALYDFNCDTVEVGKIVVGDPNASGKKIGYYAKMLAMLVAFETLSIDTVLTEVHEHNMPAWTNDMKIGFSLIKKIPFDGGGNELCMKINRLDFMAKHPLFSAVSITSL